MQQIPCKVYLRPSSKGNKKMEINKNYFCSKVLEYGKRTYLRIYIIMSLFSGGGGREKLLTISIMCCLHEIRTSVLEFLHTKVISM